MKGQGRAITFSELSVHNKFLTAYNGYATIDGVAMTQIGNDRECFLDSKGKTTDYHTTKQTDGRKEANEKRKGQALKRNGKYVRSTEVRRTVIAWVAAIGGIHKVKFTTITFPEGTNDKLAKKAFNIFLTRWRKIVPEISYLWTAERQKNGTLHFHMVHTHYTDIQKLNGFMRATLKNLANQIPNYSKDQAGRYNGVDVGKKVYSKIGIEKYLAKYLTKAQKSGINQPWHRSREMGQLATKVRINRERVEGLMGLAYLNADCEDITLRVFENDYCLFIAWPDSLSQHIKFHLDAYNRARWKGAKKPYKYPSTVQLATVPKELPLSETNTAIGLQLNILNSFPVTNYQTRGKRVR